jgi:N-acetylneuraminic acid mutarotase
MTGQVLLQGPISLEPTVIYSTPDTSYFNSFLKDIRKSGITLFKESKREDKYLKQYISRYKDNRFIIVVTRTQYPNKNQTENQNQISVMWSH